MANLSTVRRSPGDGGFAIRLRFIDELDGRAKVVASSPAEFAPCGSLQCRSGPFNLVGSVTPHVAKPVQSDFLDRLGLGPGINERSPLGHHGNSFSTGEGIASELPETEIHPGILVDLRHQCLWVNPAVRSGTQ